MQINHLKTKPITHGDRLWVHWLQVVGLCVVTIFTMGRCLIPWEGNPRIILRLLIGTCGVASSAGAIAKVRQLQYFDKYYKFREVMREDHFLEVQAQQSQKVEAPEVAIAANPALNLEINWGEVLSFPHLAVVGKTGSGKSALTQWLSTQMNGEVSVYDSDASPDEWQGLQVVGRGADYGAIAAAMESDLEELQRRTELRAVGKNNFPLMVRILEESPETLSALKDEGHDIGYKWLKGILRRGRKYGIKLILLSQGFSVRSLRIEGEGELRDNIAVLRLGKVALQYAKDEAIKQALKSQSRPLLIEDDLVGCVPDLGNFLQGQMVGDRPTPPENPPAPSLPPAPDLRQGRATLERLWAMDCANAPDDEILLPECPKCGSENVRTQGFRNGKQRYRCKDCGKNF